MANALGIDVEEWYHIRGLNLPIGLSDEYESRVVEDTHRVLDILDLMQTRATFFVLGVVAEQFPELVEEIDERGHEIACHGYQHIETYKYTEESFRDDIKKSLSILRTLTKKPVVGYRAPEFSITNQSLWVFDVLAEEGIKYDCSILPVRHKRYGIHSAPRVHYRIRENLTEFPVSTVRLLGENFSFTGGTNFRTWPYWYIKMAVEHLRKQGLAVNAYMRVWEIDPKQPRLSMPFKERYAHYHGLSKFQNRFQQLLADFQFAPIQDVLAEIQY